ncbi:MAG: carboxypeptidase M32 [Coriobacteriales bacterium]|jgi:carboxypeptidase Taq|nr:carboxypeptidase M32 [Coriobacteriales bacterium]
MTDTSTNMNQTTEKQHLRIPGTPDMASPAAIDNPKADLAALDMLERHLFAHRYATSGITTYNATIDPPKAAADSGEAMAILEQEDHELLCSEATGALLSRLASHSELLTETQKAQVRILQRDRDALVNVPAEEEAAFTRLITEAYDVWRRAKTSNNWGMFAPYLDRIVASMKTIATFKDPDKDPYDVWLDEHEHGMSRAFYDTFFSQVKDVVVPLLADVIASGKQPSRRMFQGKFDAQRQWALSQDLMKLEGLDMDAMLLLKTEHPFSNALTTNYGFIATHIHEDDVLSNVYSMLHEGGHALYELNVNPAYNYISLKGGTSMGMHEGQSRFFENYVGRSEEYAPTLYRALKKHFPGQMNRATARQLYLAANRAEPGLIRTEADELTYPLHIIIRYEIEQLLMSGEATAADVPKLWAEKYQSYLGVRVPDDAHGALQDVHWSQGSIGYFPTYALGSAFGAQLRAAMIAQGVEFSRHLSEGNLAPIRDWLRTNVWWFGRSKDADQIIKDATGEAFSAHFFTDYLVEKYTSIYGL